MWVIFFLLVNKMSTQVEIFDRETQGLVLNNGSRPQLYLVAAGSYATAAVYGSGAASTGNYDTVTLRGDTSSLQQSGSAYRKEARNVYFTTIISLDSAQTDPFANQATAELRIRTKRPLSSAEPGSYLNQLPLPDPNYPLPLFFDCEILGMNDGQPLLPTQANSLVQARLLVGGDIALVRRAMGAPPVDTALTAGDLAALFGQVSVPNTIRIIVRGDYRTS